ncbi:hypothetical protein HHI36_003327 [Cryptolaemus montrouzieri]|uniref:Uncharacterized protein n=1 Tax=Cryptolaemus montrouzieri TaxID=559131 RepID=A0ABD2PDK9_9CUCU
MNLRWLFCLYFLFKVSKSEIRNCCQGENIIASKKCVEGSLNDVLGCSTRFLMKRTEFDNVDESKGVITFGVETVTNDRFCRVNIKNSEAFIVCYKPDESGDSSTIFAILGFVSAVFCSSLLPFI